jgi:hypothetical protein
MERQPDLDEGDLRRHPFRIGKKRGLGHDAVGLVDITLDEGAAVDVQSHAPRSCEIRSVVVGVPLAGRCRTTGSGGASTTRVIQPWETPRSRLSCPGTGTICAILRPRLVTVTTSPSLTRSRCSDSRAFSSRTPTSMWSLYHDSASLVTTSTCYPRSRAGQTAASRHGTLRPWTRGQRSRPSEPSGSSRTDRSTRTT